MWMWVLRCRAWVCSTRRSRWQIVNGEAPGARYQRGARGPYVGKVRLSAETYWPQLGGRAVDQVIQWNITLFDRKVRPAPLVLSRMSSVHGHWFPLLDGAASQRTGTEGPLVAQARGYKPPNPVMSVSRSDLLRGMMFRLRDQDGLGRLDPNCAAWCALVMQLHHRLTGEVIWASPAVETTVPSGELGGGVFRPARKAWVQADCPDTRAPSLPPLAIAGWPGDRKSTRL